MEQNFDAVIIGGGASGLMCAISAKLNNPKLNIAILEKNDRVGKKLLSTGNGRCNLTNKNVSGDKYTGTFAEFSRGIFKYYNTAFLLDYFNKLGLLTVSDSEGRYYPASKQASSVLDILRYNCERLGIIIMCSQDIRSIKSQNGFLIKTADSMIRCEKLVICCGSKASPKLGGSASGLDYLQNFGHTAVKFSPALCPVKVDSSVIRSVKGLRAYGKASLYRGKELIKEETGEIQFAENALSGICVFNLSLYSRVNDVIKLDIASYISKEELYSHLADNKARFGFLSAENIFTGILQKRLAQAVLKLCKVNLGKSISDITENELKSAAHTAKNMEFKVSGNEGFDKAQCALGGVKGSEIDSNTMMSKRINNLYVCGEAVDICGVCGGYNLHFAFISGIIAGENL